MKLAKSIFTTLFMLLIGHTGLSAQIIPRLLDHFPIRVTERISFFPAPSLSYSPETDLSLGLALITNFYSNDSISNKLSVTQLDLTVTRKHQSVIDLDYQVYPFKHWVFFGSNSFYDYPNSYYSLSNPENSEPIHYRKTEFDNRAFRQISGNLYGGIIHHFQRVRMNKPVDAGLLEMEKPIGYQGGISNGFGWGLLADKRSNSLNPEPGSYYLLINMVAFSPGLGSEYQFNRFEADFRYYLPVFKRQLIGLQLSSVINTGQPPFLLSSQLGGSRILRGYHSRQYIGKALLAGQAEARLHVYKRLGITIFTGVGILSHEYENAEKHLTRTACGMGLRFLIDKHNNTNLRFDIAKGSGPVLYYFSYGEAF